MKDWLANNWPILVCAILYVIERTTSTPTRWKTLAKTLATAIEAWGSSPDVKRLKQAVTLHTTNGDPAARNALLEILPAISGQKKEARPKWKVVLEGILRFLPILSRIRPF